MNTPRKQYYFLSFSLNGKNQGCCVMYSSNVIQAEHDAKRLPNCPNADSIASFLLFEPEKGMEINKFYTSEEMDSMGFKKL